MCALSNEQNGQLVVKWKGLVLPVLLDITDDWQVQAVTEHRTKYVRVLRREVNGTDRWYTQLVQEGRSPRRKNQPVGSDVIGLDLGPSAIAAVSSADAILETFCPEVVVPTAAIRRDQRKMDRSRRATNPEAFNADGTYKKGAKIQVRSKSYQKTRAKKADRERKTRRGTEALSRRVEQPCDRARCDDQDGRRQLQELAARLVRKECW